MRCVLVWRGVVRPLPPMSSRKASTEPFLIFTLKDGAVDQKILRSRGLAMELVGTKMVWGEKSSVSGASSA